MDAVDDLGICVTPSPESVNRRNFLWLGDASLAGSAIGAIEVGAYADQIEPQYLVLERRTIRLPTCVLPGRIPDSVDV